MSVPPVPCLVVVLNRKIEVWGREVWKSKFQREQRIGTREGVLRAPVFLTPPAAGPSL